MRPVIVLESTRETIYLLCGLGPARSTAVILCAGRAVTPSIGPCSAGALHQRWRCHPVSRLISTLSPCRRPRPALHGSDTWWSVPEADTGGRRARAGHARLGSALSCSLKLVGGGRVVVMCGTSGILMVGAVPLASDMGISEDSAPFWLNRIFGSGRKRKTSTSRDIGE